MTRKNPKVLVVATSQDHLTADIPTGLWLEEFVVPCRLLQEANITVDVASPKGGQVPIDRKSLEGFPRDDYAAEERHLQDTAVLASVAYADYDAVFFPGGHGPVVDLPENPEVMALLADFHGQQKPIAAVCHGTAALMGCRVNGQAIFADKDVTGFSDEEEEAVGLLDKVPYSLEQGIKNLGGSYKRGSAWSSFVMQDGPLLTGQNPQSSEELGKKLVAIIQNTAGMPT